MEKSKQSLELSKSKAKRIERQKEVASQKRKKVTSTIIKVLVAIVILGCIGFFAGKAIYEKSRITSSISDFSKGLTDEGLIEGIKVSDYLTLCDLDNLVVPMSEVEATEDEIQDSITSTLNNNKYLSDDASLEVADGDTVNIDYVGRIDGEAFDNGSAEGSDLTIGSGSFIDTFEQQLIGSHPGDEVIVNVTFPEDYSSTELAGKAAEFTVNVNGINVVPDFTDEFVSENLSEFATTVEEYRAYLADNFYNQHLEEYLATYIIDNSEIISYPKSYISTLKGVTKYNDEYNFAYYNSLFSSYGMSAYETLWDMRGVEDEMAYEDELITRAQDSCKTALVNQAIYEKYNLSIDFDEYCAEITANNSDESAIDNMLETYGKGYMMQAEISNVVMDYLLANVNVQ